MKLGLIILMLIMGLIVGCKQNEDKKNTETVIVKHPASVEGLVLKKNILKREIKVSGITSGIREAYVVSETQGRLTSVNFTLGQYVKKGYILVTVENAIQKRAFAQANKIVESAQINSDVTHKLFENGNSSKMELSSVQNQLEGALATLEQSKKSLMDTRVIAPISGYIAQKDEVLQTGNILKGGTLLTRIVEIARLKTVVYVGELEIGMIHKGQNVSITIPAVKNSVYSGKVNAIAAGSNPATGSFPVEIVWKNDNHYRVKSGMSVSTIIQTNITDSTIIIPSKALLIKNEKSAVYINRNNKVIIQFVSTGRKTDVHTEITAGLKEGAIIITSGLNSIAVGDSIIVSINEFAGGVE